MNLALIVLFVYNRPAHTKQTVAALQKNELASESELYIYLDEVKNEAGSNSFMISPTKWIENTNAIGIVSKSEHHGDTFAKLIKKEIHQLKC